MKNTADKLEVSGIILAAGYGTRMRPLTDTIPKPLLPILGIPLLELVVERLLRAGASRIEANLFHLAEQIEAFASPRHWPLGFHREPALLGTGGGIGNMADSLSESDVIILQNGDILSDIDFVPAIARHMERGALVTMILLPCGAEPAVGEVSRRPPPAVSVAGDGAIVAIGTERATPAPSLGYSGMAVLSPDALRYFPRREPGGFVESLLAMIEAEPGSVAAYVPESTGGEPAWGEIGSIAGYIDIHRRILIERTFFDPDLIPPPLPLHVGTGSVVDPGAEWRGFLEVGSGVRIERDVVLEDCVVLDGTVVAAGSAHRRAALFPGGVISSNGGYTTERSRHDD